MTPAAGAEGQGHYGWTFLSSFLLQRLRSFGRPARKTVVRDSILELTDTENDAGLRLHRPATRPLLTNTLSAAGPACSLTPQSLIVWRSSAESEPLSREVNWFLWQLHVRVKPTECRSRRDDHSRTMQIPLDRCPLREPASTACQTHPLLTASPRKDRGSGSCRKVRGDCSPSNLGHSSNRAMMMPAGYGAG